MRYLHLIKPHLDDPMSMDLLHAMMIGEFLRLTGVRHVVEVGCCWGVSTAAALEALSWYGSRASYTAIDPEIKPTVQVMVDDARTHGVRINVVEGESLSPSALAAHANQQTVVILDGDHSPEVVSEEFRICMIAATPAVILHDCGSEGGLPGPRGVLDAHVGRHDAIDEKRRAGMRTERGLAILPCPHWPESHKARLAMEAWR